MPMFHSVRRIKSSTSPDLTARRRRAAALARPALISLALTGLAVAETTPHADPPALPADQPAPRIETPAPDAAPGAAAAKLTLRRSGAVSQPWAEIASYDAAGRRAYTAGGPLVAEIDLRRPTHPAWIRQFDMSEAAGFGKAEGDYKNAGQATHVAVDPAGRQIAAATVCPKNFAAREGKVVFFHMPTGVMLKALTVGFNPDALAFTADGSKLVVVNEGRPDVGEDGAVIDPPGSLSVIDLTGLADAETLVRQLDRSRVTTVGFEGPALTRALAKDGPEDDRPNGAPIRINPANKDRPELDLEPESLVVHDQTVYVTLQENNAIATFDLASMQWTRIDGLGFIEQTIDASDYDGGIKIAQKVLGMPMPDQIAFVEIAGKPYLITANEGDERGDFNDRKTPLGDAASVRDLARWNKLAPSLMSTADLSDPVLGRLRVSVIDGDFDGDGLIEKPVMFGTRSVSIWDARTMKRVGDTGSMFEQAMAERAKTIFNGERIGQDEPPEFQFDNRSAKRGPEPEGVAVVRLAGHYFAFVTLERPGALAALDITDPAAPRLVDFVPTALAGDVGPEGVVVVPADQSPASEPMLIICSENTGSLTTYRVIAE